ncbi:MAG: hypothetical protein IT161_12870 [Bryobacterales bacterium]|nr:hypothetical protein [Bryobacterales bacterium]
MVQHIEDRLEATSLPEVHTKPPPQTEQPEAPLFQTMNDLRVRHGNQTEAKDRLYLWGGGLLLGSFLFGLLYLMILFLE